MSTHARPLAVWLAAATDSQLSALFEARGVRFDSSWSDFFDAAEHLLDPASIERMLPRLTLQEATALRRAVDRTATSAAGGEEDLVIDEGDRADTTAALVAVALLRPDGTAYPPIVDAVTARDLPPTPHPDPTTSSSEIAEAHAAERAFTSVAALADLLMLAREAPLALLTSGTLAAGEKRRLGDAGLPVEIMDALVMLAEDAALVTTTHRQLRLTSTGENWLRLAALERWTRLSEAFRVALPNGLRTSAGGWLPVPLWEHQHPWDPSWHERCAALRSRARLLGLIADDDSEPTWAVPIREGRRVEVAALQRLLPDEVDRIFLQNDLSAIAPGPLAPALDVRLRGMASRESAAQASSYRFTAESISHAIASGETASSILDFLGQLSLTGIPQPLEYLVMQTAQRHGLVRVFADPETERTRVTSQDSTLLDAMGVDQALRPLGLSRDASGLTSRVGRDTVYWALTDARYPATIVGADGQPQIIDRNPAPSTGDTTPQSYDALIARLRAHQGPDADAAWLDRELEAAVRTKAVLLVAVGMPDGSTRELLLEATGLGGGRLRGRDRAADVERTLPVRSILSARVFDPSPTPPTTSSP
ncbi:helicase-associated domain-containing protein [Microbacterium sp.]|uniref:helicase-associated domain-containing protein n=1 Tax=Microbacterium sp. TaxID=51671 RepID=UPI002732C01C|nr:helicase-associated domain-containing protein [Microbacterium sp.]MDP3949946.1 helicase-associated domain-containing protein [Microbacterium sp.]